MLDISVGERPWTPHADAQFLDSIVYYEIPLSGFFRLDDNVYLFSCEDGELSDLSVWSYALLNDTDANGIYSLMFDTVQDARKWIDERIDTGAEVIVVAVDDCVDTVFQIDGTSSPRDQIRSVISSAI